MMQQQVLQRCTAGQRSQGCPVASVQLQDRRLLLQPVLQANILRPVLKDAAAVLLLPKTCRPTRS